jgi:hypothetical protein
MFIKLRYKKKKQKFLFYNLFYFFLEKRGSGGDRKLSNKHDPYAYIKLDFNALNKR